MQWGEGQNEGKRSFISPAVLLRESWEEKAGNVENDFLELRESSAEFRVSFLGAVDNKRK